MKKTIFIFSTTMLVVMVLGNSMLVGFANAQQAPPPPLEKPTEETTPGGEQISIGKIIIQISQTEQLVIDLPIKNENKYKIIPIQVNTFYSYFFSLLV